MSPHATLAAGETVFAAKRRAAWVIDACDLAREFPAGFGAPRIRALDGATLRVAAGEVVGLLGTNGSGKTTLLKLLLGLQEPADGRCRLFGVPARSAAARRGLGFLGEAAEFPRFLTGRELVECAARFQGLDAPVARTRATELLTWAGLAADADRRLAHYSQGMRQRVGLAQALVHDPTLLILDEPTTGLDPVGVAEFGALVRDLAARGKSILLSSHHLAQVEAICSRVVILQRGRVVADRALGARRGTDCPIRDENDTANRDASPIGEPPIPAGELEEFFLRAVTATSASGPAVAGSTSSIVNATPPSRSGTGRDAPAESADDGGSLLDREFEPEPDSKTQNPKPKTSHRVAFLSSLTRVRLVARLTLRETLRQRAPYLALFLAVALVYAAQFLRGFDFGRSELKFLAEVGLGAIGVFTSALAVAVVGQSFATSVERGGATWQLATRLRRAEFLLGNLFGAWAALGGFLAVLLTLLALQVGARAFELGAPIGGAMLPLIGAGLAQLVKLGVVLALALLLASWVRAPLLVLGAGWLLVAACHLQPFAQHAWSHATSPLARGVGAWLALTLPNLALFERGVGADGTGLAGSAGWIAYGFPYLAGLLALAALAFRRRSL